MKKLAILLSLSIALTTQYAYAETVKNKIVTVKCELHKNGDVLYTAQMDGDNIVNGIWISEVMHVFNPCTYKIRNISTREISILSTIKK